MTACRLLHRLSALLACALLCTGALAQNNGITELGGERVPPAGSTSVVTSARFAMGITTDNGVSWRGSVTPTETLRIVGRIRPEAAQIGQRADIFLLARDGGVVLMRRVDGGFEPWNGQLSALLPYQQQTLLTADTELTLYAGQLGVSGQFQLYLGYRGGDGVLHYSAAPFALNSGAGSSGAATWLFNGTAWQASGTPGDCPSPLLQAPLDLGKVTSILYPGQTRGGDYKAHGGFRLDGAGQTNQVDVTAAIAGSVVRGVRYIEQGVVQYMFDILHPCGLMMRMDHLLGLSPKFAAIADTLPPASASTVTTTLSGYSVSAGELIATAIGFPGNVSMDLGIYDLRSRNPATTTMSGEFKPYGICWLDALPAADRARVRSLPAADGVAGSTSDYCR